jgi:hypothetical protein
LLHGAVALKGLVEHSAKDEAVDGAGVQAEPNDRELSVGLRN